MQGGNGHQLPVSVEVVFHVRLERLEVSWVLDAHHEAHIQGHAEDPPRRRLGAVDAEVLVEAAAEQLHLVPVPGERRPRHARDALVGVGRHPGHEAAAEHHAAAPTVDRGPVLLLMRGENKLVGLRGHAEEVQLAGVQRAQHSLQDVRADKSIIVCDEEPVRSSAPAAVHRLHELGDTPRELRQLEGVDLVRVCALVAPGWDVGLPAPLVNGVLHHDDAGAPLGRLLQRGVRGEGQPLADPRAPGAPERPHPSLVVEAIGLDADS
mmetsp:Transcript_103188/g.328169  ORF Transcript_103188/g.328169 Transcript_103188/m.328169 type:complete len:265 (+) Transcript_103188:121-915(+)